MSYPPPAKQKAGIWLPVRPAGYYTTDRAIWGFLGQGNLLDQRRIRPQGVIRPHRARNHRGQHERVRQHDHFRQPEEW